MSGETRLSELAGRVKAIQRQSDKSKQQWWAWCDAHGGGVRDPQRHTATFLERFFEALESGTIPEIDTIGTSPATDEKGELANRVKRGQRTSMEFKQQWWVYCDTLGGGIRDPSRHDVAFLKRFFDRYAPTQDEGATATGGQTATGALGEHLHGTGADAAGEDADRMWVVHCIEYVRAQSEAWEAQWRWYCGAFGAGVSEPRLHGTPFLRQFFAMVSAPAAPAGPEKVPLVAPGDRCHPYGAPPLHGASLVSAPELSATGIAPNCPVSSVWNGVTAYGTTPLTTQVLPPCDPQQQQQGF